MISPTARIPRSTVILGCCSRTWAKIPCQMTNGQAKLHMARALIMNPEILILEKPLMFLGDVYTGRRTSREMMDLPRPPDDTRNLQWISCGCEKQTLPFNIQHDVSQTIEIPTNMFCYTWYRSRYRNLTRKEFGLKNKGRAQKKNME